VKFIKQNMGGKSKSKRDLRKNQKKNNIGRKKKNLVERREKAKEAPRGGVARRDPSLCLKNLTRKRGRSRSWERQRTP